MLGMIIAAPAAWTMRAAISAPTEGDTAHRAEPTVKVARPSRNIRRRPILSANRPAGTSSAASTIAYALRIQLSSLSEAPEKSSAIAGKPMLTMNRSRLAMNTPSEVMKRMRQR